MDRDKKIIEYIEKCYANTHVPSLRELGRIFNTSHSQIKRILKRNNFFKTYKEYKNDLENCVEDNTCFSYTTKKNFPTEYKVGFICDIHFPSHNVNAFKYTLNYLKCEGIDKLVLGGDIIDLLSVSYWDNNNLQLNEEIQQVREFIESIRDIFPNIEIDWIEGNHCLRLKRYIQSNASKLQDLDVLKIENLFNLSSYNIRYVSNIDNLAEGLGVYKIGKLAYIHGHEVKMSWNGVNIARTMFFKVVDNVIFGHFHKTQDFIMTSAMGNKLQVHSVGCLCNLNPIYSPINAWNLGFAVVKYSKDLSDFIVDNEIIY